MNCTSVSPPNSHNTLWDRQRFTHFTNRETTAQRAYWFSQFPQFANKAHLWDYMGPSCTTCLHLPFSFILFFLSTSLSSCICCVNWLKTKLWFKEGSCKPMNRQTFDRKHKHLRNKENKQSLGEENRRSSSILRNKELGQPTSAGRSHTLSVWKAKSVFSSHLQILQKFYPGFVWRSGEEVCPGFRQVVPERWRGLKYRSELPLHRSDTRNTFPRPNHTHSKHGICT